MKEEFLQPYPLGIACNQYGGRVKPKSERFLDCVHKAGANDEFMRWLDVAIDAIEKQCLGKRLVFASLLNRMHYIVLSEKQSVKSRAKLVRYIRFVHRKYKGKALLLPQDMSHFLAHRVSKRECLGSHQTM